LWQQLWPGAKIVAVEPDAANLRMVRKNSAAGGAARQPVCIAAFAAGWSRPVHVDRDRSEYAFTMVEGAVSGESIEALTVPEICRRAGLDGTIDLLKVDIEGAEAEIFANCGDWISRVRHVAIELHAPYDVEQLRAHLAKAGVNAHWHQVIDKGSLSLAFLTLCGGSAA
jgi:FkbM family methyltransferase